MEGVRLSTNCLCQSDAQQHVYMYAINMLHNALMIGNRWSPICDGITLQRFQELYIAYTVSIHESFSARVGEVTHPKLPIYSLEIYYNSKL